MGRHSATERAVVEAAASAERALRAELPPVERDRLTAAFAESLADDIHRRLLPATSNLTRSVYYALCYSVFLGAALLSARSQTGWAREFGVMAIIFWPAVACAVVYGLHHALPKAPDEDAFDVAMLAGLAVSVIVAGLVDGAGFDAIFRHLAVYFLIWCLPMAAWHVAERMVRYLRIARRRGR